MRATLVHHFCCPEQIYAVPMNRDWTKSRLSFDIHTQ